MQSSKPRTWLDRAVDEPMSMYATPAEVLRDERLDEAGMRAVLEAWVKSARRMSRGPGAQDRGRDALAALAELDRLVSAECL